MRLRTIKHVLRHLGCRVVQEVKGTDESGTMARIVVKTPQGRLVPMAIGANTHVPPGTLSEFACSIGLPPGVSLGNAQAARVAARKLGWHRPER